MKGRKPKPTNLKVLQGNAGKRPLNDNEPKPPLEIPAAPDHLGKHALVEWGRITEQLYQLGLLTNIDRAALAAYCEAYGTWSEIGEILKEMERQGNAIGKYITKTTSGNVIQNPLIGVRNTAAKMMKDFLIEFGMTPSSRSRIKATPPQAEDKKGWGAL